METLSLESVTQKVLDCMSVGQMLAESWELAAIFHLPRCPALSIEEFQGLNLQATDSGTTDDIELLKLGRNEMSVAKICAANIRDLLVVAKEVDSAMQIITGLATQLIEEVDHAVYSFRAIGYMPELFGFSTYHAASKEHVLTRMFLVLCLEIEELSIRPRRISSISDWKTWEADALALIDDISHIRSGAKGITRLKGFFGAPNLDAVKSYLQNRTQRFEGFRTSVVLDRLIEGRDIKTWLAAIAC